jgi:hypothetical protein
MAKEKTKRSLAALVHVITYTLLFLLLTRSVASLSVIAGTHFVIDRWRLARFVCWAKNLPYPGHLPWAECRATGYPPTTPVWLATWLMIVVDNTMHVVINGAALRWLT